MLNIATDYITKTNMSTKKDGMKYVITMCLFFATLILGRVTNDMMLYAFAVVSFIVFLFSSISHCFSLLLFLLPFASILKTDVDGMSFFTILFFTFVIKMMFTKKTISKKILISLMTFILYTLCFSGFEQIKTIITMAFGMIMLYYLRTAKIDVNLSVFTFSFGIILSSAIALLKTVFPIINTFVVDSAIKLGSEQYALRFSGLQGNPNYYTLDIIIALAAIMVLMYRKSNTQISTVCFIVLSVFGLMSVSKSFLLSWILLVVFWFVLSIKQGARKFIKFIIIAIICCAVVYFCAFDSINTYILRFTEDNGGTLESMTTGRTDIWKIYTETIFYNIKIFFFGNGLNTTILGVKGTHNTYLEIIFSLGLTGCSLFIVSIRNCMGKIISKSIMLVPIIILLIRMLAIGILTYDNLWFYLAIIVCLSRYVRSAEGEV